MHFQAIDLKQRTMRSETQERGKFDYCSTLFPSKCAQAMDTHKRKEKSGRVQMMFLIR